MLERLKKRREFLRVAGARRKWATPGLILQAAAREARGAPEGEALVPRVGFTVSRKVGGAVTRNRVKRRLRVAADRVLAAHATGGHDYVVIGRKSSIGRPFDSLLADLETALKRLHLYNDGGGVDTAGGE